MKVIITAGGTSEKIDDVRSITNTSTGSLGLAIGKHLLESHDDLEQLYYLHGLRAKAAEGENVTAIPVGGVRDLERELKKILTTEKIDAVIHAMAVSDYMVKEVTTLESIQSGKSAPLEGNKISSSIDDLTIVLQRSPKVIGKIKGWSPETVLVGFKLLSHVPHEELIEVGYNLLKKNGCSFVMANDLKDIKPGMHKGYLIHEDGTYDSMGTNEEIAEMISKRVWEECK